jgi:hypothetical protein
MEDEGRGKADSSRLGRERGLRGIQAKTKEGSEERGRARSERCSTGYAYDALVPAPAQTNGHWSSGAAVERARIARRRYTCIFLALLPPVRYSAREVKPPVLWRVDTPLTPLRPQISDEKRKEINGHLIRVTAHLHSTLHTTTLSCTRREIRHRVRYHFLWDA